MVFQIISLVLSLVRPHAGSLDVKVGSFFFPLQIGQGIMRLALMGGGRSGLFVVHS